MRFLLPTLSAWLLAACATVHPTPSTPLLKLSPASLDRELTMAQQLVVQMGNKELALDVALEADASSVRMAVLQFGRTLARLEWDGQQLTRNTAPGWTDAALAERVLNDLQLVWWPAPAISAALPAGWTLSESATRRTLAHQGRAVVTITLPDPNRIAIDHPQEGYAVRVQTDAPGPIFQAAP